MAQEDPDEGEELMLKVGSSWVNCHNARMKHNWVVFGNKESSQTEELWEWRSGGIEGEDGGILGRVGCGRGECWVFKGVPQLHSSIRIIVATGEKGN